MRLQRIVAGLPSRGLRRAEPSRDEYHLRLRFACTMLNGLITEGAQDGRKKMDRVCCERD